MTLFSDLSIDFISSARTALFQTSMVGFTGFYLVFFVFVAILAPCRRRGGACRYRWPLGSGRAGNGRQLATVRLRACSIQSITEFM